jgi:hypothetical protein
LARIELEDREEAIRDTCLAGSLAEGTPGRPDKANGRHVCRATGVDETWRFGEEFARRVMTRYQGP